MTWLPLSDGLRWLASVWCAVRVRGWTEQIIFSICWFSIVWMAELFYFTCKSWWLSWIFIIFTARAALGPHRNAMAEFPHSPFPKKSPPSLGLSLEAFCIGVFWTSSAQKCQLCFVVVHGCLPLGIAPELQKDDSSGLLRVIYEKKLPYATFLRRCINSYHP